MKKQLLNINKINSKYYSFVFTLLFFLFTKNTVALVAPINFNYPTSGITMKACPGQLFSIYTQIALCSGCSGASTNNSSDCYVYELYSWPSLTPLSSIPCVSSDTRYVGRTETTPGTYQYKIKATNTKDVTGSVAYSPVITVIVEKAAINPSGNIAICQGGSVILNANSSLNAITALPMAYYSTPYFYQWFKNAVSIPSATLSAYTATAAGSYYVQVSNNGTFNPSSVPVYQSCFNNSLPTTITLVNSPASASITALSSTTFCAGDSVTLNYPNAGGPLTYQWQFNGANIAGATGPSFNAKNAGNYTLVFNPSTNCSQTSNNLSVNIIIGPTVTVITAATTTTFCNGGSVILNSNATSGTTYQWYLNGNIINGANSSNYSATQSGNYQIKSTLISTGCSLYSNAISVNVIVVAPPIISVSQAGNYTLCSVIDTSYTPDVFTRCCPANNILNLTAQSGYNSYAWGFGTGASYFNVFLSNGVPSNTTTTFQTGSPGINNYYAVRAIKNGCTVYGSIQIQTPIFTVTSRTITNNTSLNFCPGGSVTLTGPSYVSSTYQWLKNGLAIPGATSYSYVATQSGNYSLSFTSYCQSCCSLPSPLLTNTLIVNAALPTASIQSQSSSICNGSYPQLIANTGSGLNYQWQKNGLNIAGATASTYTANAVGDYAVVITNTLNCSATSNTISIAVNNSPTVTANATSSVVCLGQSLTLTGAGASTYTWTGGITNGAAFSPTVTSTYTVIGTAATGCTNIAIKQITVNNLPVVTANATSSAVCLGQTTTLSGGGATTYVWSGGVTNGVAFAPTVNATYTVTGTDVNGCINTATKQIAVNNLPTVTANATSTVVCSGQSITLSGGGASTYVWSGGVTNGTAFTPTANATYTVTGTDVNGCSSAGVQSIIVNNLPAANINTSGPTTFCQGGSVILTADASNSYLWSNGATTQTVSATQTNNYTVQVTDINGCSASSSVTSVNVNPTLVANITAAGATTFCQGGSVLLTANSASSYLWSNGAITQTINVTQAGSYSVQLTSGAGCSGSSSITTIVVNALPIVNITPSGPTTFCQGGSVILACTNGNSYLWSDGTTNQNNTINQSGNFTVQITDNNGCTNTSSITTITVNNLPSANISESGPTTFCQGGSVILTAGASNSYLWSNGATTQTVIATQTNNYTVQVTDINGCSASSSVTSVNVNPTLVANITASGATTFCQGGSVTLTATNANTYLWSNGAITQTINVTQAGNYTVQLTSGAGCSGTSSITTIVVNPSPNVTLGSIQSPLCVNNATVTLSGNPAGGVYNGIGVSGSSFDPSVSGAGTFTVNYNYTDANTCSATASQSVNVNLCTGILELNSETVSVYPNPASNMINVKMNTTLINNATLELYDATGKLIMQQKVVNEYSALNISGLANGIYTVRIITDNEQTIKRIVKQQ